MKKNLFILFLTLLCACSESQDLFLENQTDELISETSVDNETVEVTEAIALRVAGNFLFKEKSRKIGCKEERVFTINDSLNIPVMYVINYSGGGFVIISARKTYYPVLAYSDKSNFSREYLISGLEEWMQYIKKNILNSEIVKDTLQSHVHYLWTLYGGVDNGNTMSYSRSTIDESNAYAARLTELRKSHPGYRFYPLSNCASSFFSYGGEEILSDFKRRASQYGSPENYTIVAIKDNTRTRTVGPLLTTVWHQDLPFNAQCPNHSKAGCVAIAMAQIMKYHKYPDTYNWDNMPDATATIDTQHLIYEVGKAVHMDYGAKESGSNIKEAQKAFSNYFQYNAVIKDFDYSETANELFVHKRPIYMRGADNKFLIWDWDGHAWVCDGANDIDYETLYFIEYRHGGPGYYSYSSPDYPSCSDPAKSGYGKLYFHMNWGWKNGTHNGWYLLDNVNVGNYNFKYGRKNLYVSPR